ncbi:hypothetical protein DSO57_1001508 [Entomophthora muscae]|uniref:Uncharacterized protein n=1 Tax=Entomophthora muscae TaxID=34485 RepID=A0ACC2UUX8_9FUNG|nr:hypothetical protein DSO57_1001508 [Entomophthora muscae]
MNRQSHSQPASAPACRAAFPRGRPRGSKNRPRTQLKGSNADTQASQGVSASQPPPASQARNSSLNLRQKPLSRPATKVSYTRVTGNNEVTYPSIVYPVVTRPVRAQSALDSQLAFLKHFPGQNSPLSTNEGPGIQEAHNPQIPGIEPVNKSGPPTYREMAHQERNRLIARLGD